LGGCYRYEFHEKLCYLKLRPKRVCAQNVGGELALTISHSSRPGLRNRCGKEVRK